MNRLQDWNPQGKDDILNLHLKKAQGAEDHGDRGFTQHGRHGKICPERLIVMDSGCVAYDGTPEEVFSHYKELEKIGILAPQVTYVVEGLAKKGIRLPHNAINVKQAADAILAYRKGER